MRADIPFLWIRSSTGNISAVLEAFTPIIPGNLLSSTLPAFEISIRIDGSKEGRIVLSASNITDISVIGRVNEVRNGSVLVMRNARASNIDPYNGEIAIASSNMNEIIPQYNVHVHRGVEKMMIILRGFWGNTERFYVINDADDSLITCYKLN